MDAGRTIIETLRDSFTCYSGEPLPIQDDARSADAAFRGRDILMERVIGAAAGNYGYSLAYAREAEARLQNFMLSEEKDRAGVAGFADKAQQLMEQLMERDAQAAWLCAIVQGAVEAYEHITGKSYTLYVPVDRAKEKARTDEQKAVVADRLAAFLAARKRD
jgi:hypothetical protein